MSPIIIAGIIMVATFVSFFHPKIPNIAVAVASSLAFALTGIIPLDTLFNFYTSKVIILLIGMMTIGGALFQTGFAGWIGNRLIKITGTNVKMVQMTVFLCTAFLATVASGAATLMIMFPLMASIAISSKISMSKIVAFQMSGSLTGSFLTFTGAGMIGASAAVLEASGYDIWSFFEIAWFGVPRMIIVLIVLYFFANKVIPQDTYIMPDAEIAAAADSLPKKLTPKMILSGTIMLLTMIGLVAEIPVLPVHVVSTLGALACLFTGCLTPKQMYTAISWDVVILIGGMSAFASGMGASGFGQLIADSILLVTGANSPPIVMVLVLMLTTGFITQFMSDNAAVAIMAPIAIMIAVSSGIEPYGYVMACLIGSALCHLSIMASPVLAFTMDIGGYKPSFFVKWGLIVELIPALIAGLIVIQLVWL